MKTTADKKTTKALQQLIIINNDRYEGYMLAAEHAKEIELKNLFNRFSMQSKQFSNELKALLPDMEDAPKEDETKVSGKIYRGWMELKDKLAANDRKAVLASCEFGEDSAKRNYDDVLKDSEEIAPEVLQVIRRQREEIQKGHDTVKSMRDTA
jgi:uncharacterized protein (TIGR02284 family)